MAATRPRRHIQAPRRLGWDDDGVVEAEVMMNDESGDEEHTDSEADSESEEEYNVEIPADEEVQEWEPLDRPPHIPPFIGPTGVRFGAFPKPQEDMQILDYFHLFLDEDFFEYMATETNRYAHQVLTSMDFSQNSRVHKWRNTSSNELKAFLALFLATGLNDKPTISNYWSKDPIFANGLWSGTMSRDRFLLLHKFLHFVNNDAPRAIDGDKFYKVRVILDLLNERYQALYYPERHTAVDETLVPWTGRLSFKQYIPIKPHKYGIKVYQLCESSSGYCVKFKPYQGKEGGVVDRNHTKNVVLHLLGPLQGNGHLVWMDNYYTGIPLLEELEAQQTSAAGTVRLGRIGLPPVVKNKKLNKGEHVFRRKGNVLCLKWRDKRDVTFLSTAHSADMVDHARKTTPEGVPIRVPAIKVEYDKNMNGVDKNDQNVAQYLPRRRAIKWYKTFAFYLFSLTRFQAFLIYKKTTPHPISQLDFIRQLVTGLIEAAHLNPVVRGRPLGAPLPRLTARHFPDFIPASANKVAPTKRCVVCCVPLGKRHQEGERAPRRRESRYQCSDCGAALCITPCFRLYHTYKDFRNARQQLREQ